MYAVFGEILFEVLTSPTMFASTREYTYAEHSIVQDRPRLQWVSDALETVTLELMLHTAFTNPKTQLDALAAAASDHQARALVFGNGIHRGYFVLTTLVETHRHNASDGSLIWATARLELKEYALGATIDPFGPVLSSLAPLAIVAGLVTAANGAALVGANQPIGPANLLPDAAILTLGALPANTYAAPTYSSAGVSATVSNPAAAAGVGPASLNYSAVPASTAVRQAS